MECNEDIDVEVSLDTMMEDNFIRMVENNSNCTATIREPTTRKI